MLFPSNAAQLLSPYDAPLNRSPANKNKGKLVNLAEFLELAKQKAVTGVSIDIEVRYLFIVSHY